MQAGEDMATPSQRSVGGTESPFPASEVEILHLQSDGVLHREPGGRADQDSWVPAADVVEADGAYLIEVELPGVRREDVDVMLDGNDFVVSGEVKKVRHEGFFHRRTRRIGRFVLRITLPGDVREGEVEVSLAYGVLKAYVPKATRHGDQNPASG